MLWKISIFLSLFCVTIDIQATHLVGGTLTYKFISNTTQGENRYLVTLEIYREAQKSTVQFDDQIKIGVYHNNASKSRYQTYTFVLTSTVNPYRNCAFRDVKLELGTYSRIVDLPNSLEGYYLSFVRCCRAYEDNLHNEGTNGQPYQGLTFFAFIPPTADQNNSPVFDGFPKMINNINKTNDDFGAKDIDGDSLVYSIVAPFAGGQPTNNGSMPDPPPNLKLPVSTVVYKSGYGASNPLGTSGSVSINRTTGNITYSNSSNGMFALCIQIEEFRQGRLVGLIRREYPLIFMNIPPELEADNYLKLNKPQILFDKAVAISWDYCQSKFSKFIVERKDSTNWKVSREVTNINEISDTISENVMYYYRVVAVGDTSSTISNIDSIIIYREPEKEQLPESVYVFPNPFENNIDIRIESIKSPMTLRIYSMPGNLVYESLLVHNLHRVDATHLAGGVYYLQISRDDVMFLKTLLIRLKEH